MAWALVIIVATLPRGRRQIVRRVLDDVAELAGVVLGGPRSAVVNELLVQGARDQRRQGTVLAVRLAPEPEILVRNPLLLVNWLVVVGIVGLLVMVDQSCAGTLVRNMPAPLSLWPMPGSTRWSGIRSRSSMLIRRSACQLHWPKVCAGTEVRYPASLVKVDTMVGLPVTARSMRHQ